MSKPIIYLGSVIVCAIAAIFGLSKLNKANDKTKPIKEEHPEPVIYTEQDRIEFADTLLVRADQILTPQELQEFFDWQEMDPANRTGLCPKEWMNGTGLNYAERILSLGKWAIVAKRLNKIDYDYAKELDLWVPEQEPIDTTSYE